MDTDDSSESNAELKQMVVQLQLELEQLRNQSNQQGNRIAEIERQNAELGVSNDKLAAENAALTAKANEARGTDGNKRKRKNRMIPVDQQTLGAFGFSGKYSHTVSSVTDNNVGDSTSGGCNDNGATETADGNAPTVNGNNGTSMVSKPSDFISFEDCSDGEADMNAHIHDDHEDVASHVNDGNGTHVIEEDNTVTPTTPPQRMRWADVCSGGSKPKTPATSGKVNSSATAKPSPIQLAKLDKSTYATINAGLLKRMNGVGYQWQQVSANALPRIFANDMEAKKTILDWLVAEKIEFNTYADRGSKRKAFLIRGLAFGDDVENARKICDSLRGAGVDGEITVTRFLTPHMRRNPNPDATPIYQATVAHESLDASIAGITQIANFRIRIERMKPSSIIQCHRCQRYAHTATGCAHAYRCVQCVTVHLPGCCPRMTNKTLPLGCINCKETGRNFAGHTANDHRNCPFYASLSAKRTEAKQSAPKQSAPKQSRGAAHKEGKPSNAPTSSHTVPRLGITEAVRANNPHVKGKTGAAGRRGTEGKSNGKDGKNGGAIGHLVAALMNVLSQFQ